MFQGMFRKRGRPPEPLPIGGYDRPNDDESTQIPVHQLLEAPRQLPLPSVRELPPDVVMQQERDVGTNLSIQPLSSQHVDNISNSQDRRLAYNPLQISRSTVPRWFFYRQYNRRFSWNVPCDKWQEWSLDCGRSKSVFFLFFSRMCFHFRSRKSKSLRWRGAVSGPEVSWGHVSSRVTTCSPWLAAAFFSTGSEVRRPVPSERKDGAFSG